MQAKSLPAWLQSVLCVMLTFALATLGWLAYYGVGYKYILLAAGVGIIVLLWFGDLKQLGNLPSLLLLGYAVFAMLTIFWAVSGKFFLKRYAAGFTALFFFLYAALRVHRDWKLMHRTMAIMAGVSTIYAALGVEAFSTGLFYRLAHKLLGDAAGELGWHYTRMYGIFGNPNIEASFYAIGALLSMGLLCGSKKRNQRALWMLTLVIDLYALILSISIGAIACFSAACIVLLIAAGKERGAFLTRLLTGALCAAAGALGYFGRNFTHTGMEAPYLGAVMLFAATATAVLEVSLGERVVAFVSLHEKTVFGIGIGVLALGAAYLTVGTAMTGAYTFDESTTAIERKVVLKPGNQSIQIDADANTTVAVCSSSAEQIMLGQETVLIEGTAGEAQGATAVVPDDSVVCTVRISGEPGTEVRTVTIGGKKIGLAYTVLPAFIANRLTPLQGSESLVQRLVYVRDGLKLFRLSPIVGFGDGAFESSVSMVQDYEYEVNHSHNQYIEVLLESGIIGFVLFAGSLVTMAVVLWKSRKKMQKSELAWFYPVLCAEFVMSSLQMLWDVSMMVTVFACMIYTLYGLIVSTCAEPLVLKKTTDQEQSAGKRKKATTKAKSDVDVRLACSMLPLLFVVSVGLNIHAQRLIRKPVENVDQFMGNLQSAVKMDLYEKNDSKLSYVRAQMENDEDGIYRAQADEYADELSAVRSNAIPYLLTVYYLNTQQYEKAIDEAKRGAGWSASDSDMWNNCADALRQMFIDTGVNSPLLQKGGGSLLWGLEEYREMLLDRDARSLKPIKLTEGGQAFFDSVEILFDYRDDKDTLYALLSSVTED